MKTVETSKVMLVNTKEAAKMLGICEKSLWSRTVPRGTLPCVRLGRLVRYDPRDLQVWVDAQKEVV